LNYNKTKTNVSSIFNVGWITFSLMLILTVIAFLKSAGILLTVLIGYVGAVIGNTIRLYAMPTIYSSNGTLSDAFLKRLYWSHGPQIGGFVGIFIFLFMIGGVFHK